MIRLVIFDLDGTLAPVGKPLPEAERQRILSWEKRGVKIALSSGKPCFYLCGFARQMGLEKPLLVGENGAALQEGIELPPRRARVAEIPEKSRVALAELRRRLEKEFPDEIWYQPNETALTPFPHSEALFDPIRALLERNLMPESELCVYEHPDCFDVAYRGISKRSGVDLLSQITGIPAEEMAAVGDWVNDYPMLEAVGLSVGIRLPDPKAAKYNVSSLSEALDIIETHH